MLTKKACLRCVLIPRHPILTGALTTAPLDHPLAQIHKHTLSHMHKLMHKQTLAYTHSNNHLPTNQQVRTLKSMCTHKENSPKKEREDETICQELTFCVRRFSPFHQPLS